jgi:hypothetical protein
MPPVPSHHSRPRRGAEATIPLRQALAADDARFSGMAAYLRHALLGWWQAHGRYTISWKRMASGGRPGRATPWIPTRSGWLK